MAVHLKKRERIVKGGRERGARPKTFTTLEAAQKYAQIMKYKKFVIINLRPPEASVGKYRVDAE